MAGALAFGTACFFGGYFTYAGKLDAEIKSLIWAKEMIQNEYNYAITDEEFYDAVFDGVNGLLDPYSKYMTEEEYEKVLEESTGRWSGIGLQFNTVDEQGNPRILVSRVAINSPAEEKGVTVGSFLRAFGLTRETMVETLEFKRLSDFLTAREEGEPFFLRFEKDATEYTVELSKENFLEGNVSYRSNSTAYAFVGEETRVKEETLACLDNDTAYVRLSQFNGGAATEFDEAMSVFKQENKKNLVLDLRSNGGGYMDILCSIAGYFCKTATEANPVIARADYRNGRKVSFRAKKNVYDDYFSDDSEIIVLADNGTASASECLIGCMIDYGATEYSKVFLYDRVASKETEEGIEYFWESKTYGKGIMQSYYSKEPFGVSETIKLTTAYIVWPLSERCIHGVGVTTTDGARQMPFGSYEDREIEGAIAEFFSD